jgi:hypothetical protein
MFQEYDGCEVLVQKHAKDVGICLWGTLESNDDGFTVRVNPAGPWGLVRFYQDHIAVLSATMETSDCGPYLYLSIK